VSTALAMWAVIGKLNLRHFQNTLFCSVRRSIRLFSNDSRVSSCASHSWLPLRSAEACPSPL
jgi:hypothetical protein